MGLSLAIMGYVIYLIRQEIIELKYSVTWIFIGLGLIAISIDPGIFTAIARMLGIGLPVNALFLTAILFLLVIIMVLTIAISKLFMKCSRLAQEIALLKENFRGHARSEEPARTDGAR